MTLYAAPTTSARRLCPCRCTRSRARVDVYSLPDTAWIAHGRIARINLHTHVTVHGCSRGKRGERGFLRGRSRVEHRCPPSKSNSPRWRTLGWEWSRCRANRTGWIMPCRSDRLRLLAPKYRGCLNTEWLGDPLTVSAGCCCVRM